MYLGFAGNIAKKFLNSKLTPLLIIVALLLGVFAIFQTPKEEEPQIKVPMIDVLIPVPGFSPKLVEKRVTNLVERSLSSLDGIKHVYSTSMEGYSFITARFNVGEDLEASLVKIHHKISTLSYSLPKEAMTPIIKSYTIDDVPFYTLTFYSEKYSSHEIRQKIIPIAKDLQTINGVSEMTIIGGQRTVAKIIPDLKKLNSLGISLLEMKQAVENSNSQYLVSPIIERSPETIIAAGSFISNITDIESIPLGRRFGKTIKLGDIATVKFEADELNSKVLYGKNNLEAITVVYTKKKGVNASKLSNQISEKLESLKTTIDPEISYELTRDYGATAQEKTDELILHLILATVSVMILIALMMGFRVALVVGITVPVTLAITLLIDYLLGYTLNRVTLFALIFSIGILVDDAIVVVENIYRHLVKGEHQAKDMAILAATDEVGNPTILATFTVIVSIMPLAFVGGLMGPYMRPIPVGASIAMIFSMLIAFIITPWASKHIINEKKVKAHKEAEYRFLKYFIYWMLKKKSHTFTALMTVGFILLGSLSLIYFKTVKVKMLPFDNKSEFQILVDLEAGTNINETKKFIEELTQKLYKYPEVKNVQAYIGTAAPYSFSGMVKHTFMRKASYMADIQVNLLDKHKRTTQSHDFVNKLRVALNQEFINKKGLKLKFLEVPPGPPVMSTMLAEIYHPDEKKQYEYLKMVEAVYKNSSSIVDVDTSVPEKQEKLFFNFDREKGKIYGIPQNYATSTVLMALGNLDMFSVKVETDEEPVFMRMSLDKKDKISNTAILSLLVPSLEGDKLPLKDIMSIENKLTQDPILHKNLQRVMYVMAETAGVEESPIYAIMQVEKKLKDFKILYTGQPSIIDRAILKWDGEMDITVEVFRDLGLAFLIAIILIMILVIGWYNSFMIPFIIILPVPLSLIGIILGHLAFGAFFTATSMIGFIAMAGITVRNSILLVDFIEQKRYFGAECKTAVVEAAVVRFRPILLTALAVIVAAIVILFDPIFQGLAISLMMGSISAAFLSIPLVPVLYYWFRKDKASNYKKKEL